VIGRVEPDLFAALPIEAPQGCLISGYLKRKGRDLGHGSIRTNDADGSYGSGPLGQPEPFEQHFGLRAQHEPDHEQHRGESQERSGRDPDSFRMSSGRVGQAPPPLQRPYQIWAATGSGASCRPGHGGGRSCAVECPGEHRYSLAV
jgi:hypothetical protein